MKTLLLAALAVFLLGSAARAQCVGGGDLASSSAGCTVIGIQKTPVSPQPPSSNQILSFNAAANQYQPTSPSAVTSGAFANKTVAAPGSVTATSPTYLMLGLAGSITPKTSGAVSVSICGSTTDATLADTISMQLSYGTGAAPTNGGALAGTQVGALVQASQAVASDIQSFCSTAVISGLTVGTAYWLDLAVGSSGGHAITFGSTNVAAGEI